MKPGSLELLNRKPLLQNRRFKWWEHVTEEEKPSIKVGYTPLFTVILWIVCAIPLPALIAQGNMDAILIIICDVLFCFWLLLEMRIAVYDKKRKILTVRQ